MLAGKAIYRRKLARGNRSDTFPTLAAPSGSFLCHILFPCFELMCCILDASDVLHFSLRFRISFIKAATHLAAGWYSATAVQCRTFRRWIKLRSCLMDLPGDVRPSVWIMDWTWIETESCALCVHIRATPERERQRYNQRAIFYQAPVPGGFG